VRSGGALIPLRPPIGCRPYLPASGPCPSSIHCASVRVRRPAAAKESTARDWVGVSSALAWRGSSSAAVRRAEEEREGGRQGERERDWYCCCFRNLDSGGRDGDATGGDGNGMERSAPSSDSQTVWTHSLLAVVAAGRGAATASLCADAYEHPSSTGRYANVLHRRIRDNTTRRQICM
jgi:hypothetical protein